MDAGATVEERVRDQVRVRGIDPQLETVAVRELVDEAVAGVVAEWVAADRQLTSDRDELALHAFHAVAGFGPLQPYFDDPDVEELWINVRLTYG